MKKESHGQASHRVMWGSMLGTRKGFTSSDPAQLQDAVLVELLAEPVFAMPGKAVSRDLEEPLPGRSALVVLTETRRDRFPSNCGTKHDPRDRSPAMPPPRQCTGTERPANPSWNAGPRLRSAARRQRQRPRAAPGRCACRAPCEASLRHARQSPVARHAAVAATPCTRNATAPNSPFGKMASRQASNRFKPWNVCRYVSLRVVAAASLWPF